MNKDENKNNEGKAEEPETAYQETEKIDKKISMSSLKGLEELDRRHTANLSPLQRMEYLQKLNANLYGFDLSHQKKVLQEGKIIIKEQS